VPEPSSDAAVTIESRTDPASAVVDSARAEGAPPRVLDWLAALLRHGERAGEVKVPSSK
jgi:hypothetical protein